jgi:hypothetical protein
LFIPGLFHKLFTEFNPVSIMNDPVRDCIINGFFSD